MADMIGWWMVMNAKPHHPAVNPQDLDESAIVGHHPEACRARRLAPDSTDGNQVGCEGLDSFEKKIRSPDSIPQWQQSNETVELPAKIEASDQLQEPDDDQKRWLLEGDRDA